MRARSGEEEDIAFLAVRDIESRNSRTSEDDSAQRGVDKIFIHSGDFLPARARSHLFLAPPQSRLRFVCVMPLRFASSLRIAREQEVSTQRVRYSRFHLMSYIYVCMI